MRAVCWETAHPTREQVNNRYAGFKSDAERVAFLFERYQQLTSLLPIAQPKRGGKKSGAQ